MFKIVSDISRLPKDLEAWDKNRRFAVAVGITWTGQEVKGHLRQKMEQVFDKPTRWTLNSLFLKPAKRDDYNAKVFFKDFAPKGTPAGVYLDAQISGGDRNVKRAEQHLRRRGFLKGDMYLVPGRDAKLNAYGNLRKGQVTKALSDVGAQFNPEQNTSKRRKKYFWLTQAGRRPAGIYYRTSGQLRSFMIAVKKPAYRQRLDFYGEARKITHRRLGKNISKAMRKFAPPGKSIGRTLTGK